MSPYRKLAEMFNLKSPAPKAPRDKTVDVYHSVKVPDPYRPLEKLDDKATVSWTEGQTNRFQDFISDVGGQAKMKKFLAEIWDYERESLPDRHGKRYFSSFMDGKAAQPVYRVRDSVDGTPRTLIDPNTLSKDGTVALSGAYPSPDGTKLAYLLSESGSDAQNLYVMDVATGKTTKDTITGCRFTGVTWDRDSKGFQYNYPAEDDLRRFKVMHHKLGDSPAQDRVVFERPGVEDSIVGAARLNNEKQEPSGYEYAACRIGTNSAGAVYLKAPGEKTFSPLFEDGKSELNPIAMIEGKLYATTTLDAPKGRLVAIDPADPAPENWQTIVAEPDNSDILQWAFAHQGQLLVGYQHDTADRIALHKLDGTYKEDMPLPPQSVVGFAKVNKDDTEYLMNISGYQSPGASYKYDIATNSLKLWKTSAAKVDLEDAVIERVHATSKDGTKVPMTVIRNKDVKLDGSAATKLYGYGGFNVPLDPGFSFGTYNWVKEGGIYAVANLRGGGEFGSEWYDGGRLLKKQNVFDDFAACAEYLIDQKYTKPA
ncbi:MAG: prolyl oligopeptidase family serine peptidase, partial [Pseudomonadota bacterium]